MAGGKPVQPRFRKQKYAYTQISGSVGAAQNGSGSNPAKEPVPGGERKRHRQEQSSSVEFSGSSRKKRAKVIIPAKQPSAAVERTGRQSKNTETILDHDTATEISSSDADPGRLPEDHEAEQLRSASVLMSEIQTESPLDFGDEAGLRDGTPYSDGVWLSSGLPSIDGDQTSLAEDVNRPHPELWISFGHIQSLEHPSSSFELRIRNDGSESLNVLVGSGPECDFIVDGDDIGKYHCRITLEFDQQDDGALRRRVVVSKIKTVISSLSLRTTVWTGDQTFVVEDKMVLSTGNVIQLGDGDRYVYHGPRLSDLYAHEVSLYDPLGARIPPSRKYRGLATKASSSQRKSFMIISIWRGRKFQFTRYLAPIPKSFKLSNRFTILSRGYTVGPRIKVRCTFLIVLVQLADLIFEAGFMDLYELASTMRPTGQDVLRISAPKWTRQITEGIAHMHKHGITHRDIKPENILACFDEFECLDMKIMDMGLANQNTGPIVEQWFVGTHKWAAPGSFMVYKDDKYVDCYGIGRILFFLLTPHEWPEETRELNRACGCEEQCRVECDRRKTAFRVVEKTRAGANPKCLDFMKKVLVAHPKDCSTTEEMLKHLYLINGNRGQK